MTASSSQKAQQIQSVSILCTTLTVMTEIRKYLKQHLYFLGLNIFCFVVAREWKYKQSKKEMDGLWMGGKRKKERKRNGDRRETRLHTQTRTISYTPIPSDTHWCNGPIRRWDTLWDNKGSVNDSRLLKNKQHSEALKETHTDPLTLVLCWQEKMPKYSVIYKNMIQKYFSRYRN